MSEYREDNKEFLDLVDLVYKKLKGTRYRMYINIGEPDTDYDEDDPDPNWQDYLKYDGNPEFHEHICTNTSSMGQFIHIYDPETQKPYNGYGGDFIYANPLVSFWQDYDSGDRYELGRNAAYMYDVINYGVSIDKDSDDDGVSYKVVVDYVKKDMLNDLAVLSEMTVNLGKMHDGVKTLAKLKYRKSR